MWAFSDSFPTTPGISQSGQEFYHWANNAWQVDNLLVFGQFKSLYVKAWVKLELACTDRPASQNHCLPVYHLQVQYTTCNWSTVSWLFLDRLPDFFSVSVILSSTSCFGQNWSTGSENALIWNKSGWPSGLRRCVQVAVSPGGVGSNPTSDNGVSNLNTGPSNCNYTRTYMPVICC